ncbi:MAG: phosphatase PAP2 family protein [Ruminococcaceae bacterium]|nr:phosphatase PAP2 family protein [Oscillospiraceae bacterium]
MRKPVVDYRTFRLRRLNEPQFRHLKLLGWWLVYFALYFLTENLIPAEKCTPVHMWLDDVIPFCEIFLIPYVFWYALVVLSLLWFLLYDVEGFRGLQTYIAVTQLVAMAIYILFPSRQDLRPELLPRDNFLTDCVAFLYRVDTNTGVCPSLHVAYSLGMASAWWKAKGASLGWKLFVTAAVVLICLSTMFIKQHSAVDFFAALPVCLLAEWIAYRKWWKERRIRQ